MWRSGARTLSERFPVAVEPLRVRWQHGTDGRHLCTDQAGEEDLLPWQWGKLWRRRRRRRLRPRGCCRGAYAAHAPDSTRRCPVGLAERLARAACRTEGVGQIADRVWGRQTSLSRRASYSWRAVLSLAP